MSKWLKLSSRWTAPMPKQQPQPKRVVGIDINRIFSHSSQSGIDDYFNSYISDGNAAEASGADLNIPNESGPNDRVIHATVPNVTVPSRNVPAETVGHSTAEKRPPGGEGPAVKPDGALPPIGSEFVTAGDDSARKVSTGY